MHRTQATGFDFRKCVSYDPDAKRLFHTHARRQLRLLATTLGLATSAFEIRSNQGGIAVSGEVTMHADHLYVQASQPATGNDTGILIRSCQGRKDYVGGRNHFASLDLLNAPDLLARRIRDVPCLAKHRHTFRRVRLCRIGLYALRAPSRLLASWPTGNDPSRKDRIVPMPSSYPNGFHRYRGHRKA
jgi:hypothetical protein